MRSSDVQFLQSASLLLNCRLIFFYRAYTFVVKINKFFFADGWVGVSLFMGATRDGIRFDIFGLEYTLSLCSVYIAFGICTRKSGVPFLRDSSRRFLLLRQSF